MVFPSDGVLTKILVCEKNVFSIDFTSDFSSTWTINLFWVIPIDLQLFLGIPIKHSGPVNWLNTIFFENRANDQVIIQTSFLVLAVGLRNHLLQLILALILMKFLRLLKLIFFFCWNLKQMTMNTWTSFNNTVKPLYNGHLF